MQREVELQRHTISTIEDTSKQSLVLLLIIVVPNQTNCQFVSFCLKA